MMTSRDMKRDMMKCWVYNCSQINFYALSANLSISSSCRALLGSLPGHSSSDRQSRGVPTVLLKSALLIRAHQVSPLYVRFIIKRPLGIAEL